MSLDNDLDIRKNDKNGGLFAGLVVGSLVSLGDIYIGMTTGGYKPFFSILSVAAISSMYAFNKLLDIGGEEDRTSRASKYSLLGSLLVNAPVWSAVILGTCLKDLPYVQII